MKIYRLLILSFFVVSCISANAQIEKSELAGKSLLSASKDSTQSIKDTSTQNKPITKKDTVAKHDPRKATRRSAIIPGWGQAYNKDYWKIPIVYGILAIPVGMYIYNNNYYQKTKFAYEAKFKASQGDTSDLAFIDPEIKNLSISSLQNYRNSFRRDRDYAILWFILAWGLQVADATVFAHLNQFDVSNDLSMEVKPTFSPQSRTPGISLTMSLKNNPKKVFDAR
jgi:hypothetical protein